MKTEDIRLLRIDWAGPEAVDVVCGRAETGDCYGVYQIYGEHPVFGRDSLLYIGRARERTFQRRLEEHQRDWLSQEEGVTVRLGRLRQGDYGRGPGWQKLVEEAEALLIYWHAPPYNSANINRYTGRPLCIQNAGRRGSLAIELTSMWSVDRGLGER